MIDRCGTLQLTGLRAEARNGEFMTGPLGPFQDIWDAWDEVDKDIKSQSLAHFSQVMEAQFVELTEHLDNGDRQRAALEAIDAISVALTMLRWLDFMPKEIAALAQHRAATRMRGRAKEILDKYQA
jgi:hypothetical protein